MSGAAVITATTFSKLSVYSMYPPIVLTKKVVSHFTRYMCVLKTKEFNILGKMTDMPGSSE